MHFCSKPYCPYCVEVKKLLSELGANYKAIELDQESEYWFLFLLCVKGISDL